ncbi:hypothetical protein WKI45_08785 [Delftia tsuruhatensis]
MEIQELKRRIDQLEAEQVTAALRNGAVFHLAQALAYQCADPQFLLQCFQKFWQDSHSRLSAQSITEQRLDQVEAFFAEFEKLIPLRPGKEA